MTFEAKNEILSRFMGWKPGQKCESLTLDRAPEHDTGSIDGMAWRCTCGQLTLSDCTLSGCFDHNIPPTDYYADTIEAREAVRLLKDEYVRCAKRAVEVTTQWETNTKSCWYGVIVELDNGDRLHGYASVESHVIADAIVEVLKENRK